MRKSNLPIPNSKQAIEGIIQFEKKTPNNFHRRKAGTAALNPKVDNPARDIQKAYQFPRQISETSQNTSVSRPEKDSCEEMRGVFVYQLGMENPTTCKLAQVPIKMKRKPLLSVKQIREISLEKKSNGISSNKKIIAFNQPSSAKDQANSARQTLTRKHQSYHKLASNLSNIKTVDRFVIDSPIKGYYTKQNQQTMVPKSTERYSRNVGSFNASRQKNNSASTSKIHLSLSKLSQQPKEFNSFNQEQQCRISLARPKSKSSRKKKLQVLGNGDELRRIDSIQGFNQTDRDMENGQNSGRNPKFDKNFKTIAHSTKLGLSQKKPITPKKNNQSSEKVKRKITISVRKK